MLGKFQLFPHQLDAAKMMLTVPGLLLYYDMGSGKTIASIAAAEALLAHGMIEHAYVVMPKAVTQQFKDTLADASVNTSKYTVWTHTNILKVADLKKNSMLIVDEAHKIRGEGKIFKKLLTLAKQATKRLLLTGTPVINWPDDIAPLMALVHAHKDTPVSEYALTTQFRQQFVSSRADNQWMWKKAAHTELVPYLKCAALYYKPDAGQRVDYPTSTEHVEYVDMTDNQARWHQSTVENSASANFKAHFGEQFTDSAKLKAYYTKYREMDSVYPIKWDEVNAAPLEAPKYERCLQRIRALVANGRKAVVYSAFLRRGVYIMAYLLKRAGITYEIIEGGNTAAVNKRYQDMYNSHKISVLLLSQSGQTGLDLKNTSEIHIMEPDFNENTVQQVIGRGIRTGSHDGSVPKHVDIYRYVAKLPLRWIGQRGGLMKNASADQRLMELAMTKQRVAKDFLRFLGTVAKESMTRCLGNANDKNWPVITLNQNLLATNKTPVQAPPRAMTSAAPRKKQTKGGSKRKIGKPSLSNMDEFRMFQMWKKMRDGMM